MLDTTVDISEAPAEYAAELSTSINVGLVLTSLAAFMVAAGYWLTERGGFWPWVGWPVVLLAALFFWTGLRDVIRQIRDRSNHSVRKIESAIRKAQVHLGREISPFTSERDMQLSNSGRAHWRLILEDGSQWFLGKKQFKQVQFAKRARLWVAPSSGTVILIEVTEQQQT
jgi:hypothetical protein